MAERDEKRGTHVFASLPDLNVLHPAVCSVTQGSTDFQNSCSGRLGGSLRTTILSFAGWAGVDEADLTDASRARPAFDVDPVDEVDGCCCLIEGCLDLDGFPVVAAVAGGGVRPSASMSERESDVRGDGWLAGRGEVGKGGQRREELRG